MTGPLVDTLLDALTVLLVLERIQTHTEELSDKKDEGPWNLRGE